MARRRAGKQGTDRLDRLTVAANDATDVALSHRKAKDGGVAVRDFGDEHLVRKLDEITDNELEERFHASILVGLGTLSLPQERRLAPAAGGKKRPGGLFRGRGGLGRLLLRRRFIFLHEAADGV